MTHTNHTSVDATHLPQALDIQPTQLLTIVPKGFYGKMKDLLEGKPKKVLRIMSGKEPFDIDATRGLLRNRDGSFVEARGRPDVDELKDISVTLNPEKLEFIAQCGQDYDRFTIMKDNNFVYAFRSPLWNNEIMILSSRPENFHFLKKTNWGESLFSDGINNFLDTRLSSLKGPNVVGKVIGEKGLYLDGGLMVGKESGLDLNTVRKIGYHYFADASGKVVYDDPYPQNRGSYHKLPDGVDIANFRYIPGGHPLYEDPIDPGYLGLHTDGKRDYITRYPVRYYNDAKTGELAMEFHTIHHGSSDYLVLFDQIPRLVHSGIITREMANQDPRVQRHIRYFEEEINSLHGEILSVQDRIRGQIREKQAEMVKYIF